MDTCPEFCGMHCVSFYCNVVLCTSPDLAIIFQKMSLALMQSVVSRYIPCNLTPAVRQSPIEEHRHCYHSYPNRQGTLVQWSQDELSPHVAVTYTTQLRGHKKMSESTKGTRNKPHQTSAQEQATHTHAPCFEGDHKRIYAGSRAFNGIHVQKCSSSQHYNGNSYSH